nr:hypothetical protein CoNPh37_CDS0099 [Staphylococcus phage S-CoN_Ph37]
MFNSYYISASTEETEQPKDYLQLEQRVSSLEQRLQSLEESSRETEESSDPNFEDKTEPTELRTTKKVQILNQLMTLKKF